jgi:DNA-binding response OmpR family regulator
MKGPLAGKRVLVVEDEYFIASDLKRALADAEAVVIGPVADLAQGLALASEPLDAAVLDVNLEGALSYQLASDLAERGVPYLFVTGYDEWALPEEHRSTPRVAKPFTPRMVIEQVEQLIARLDA